MESRGPSSLVVHNTFFYVLLAVAPDTRSVAVFHDFRSRLKPFKARTRRTQSKSRFYSMYRSAAAVPGDALPKQSYIQNDHAVTRLMTVGEDTTEWHTVPQCHQLSPARVTPIFGARAPCNFHLFVCRGGGCHLPRFHITPPTPTTTRHKLLHSSAGAYGAHGLAGKSDKTRADWKTATHYHLCHALALATLPAFQKTPARTAAGLFFSTGITLFSGSIYYACGCCRFFSFFWGGWFFLFVVHTHGERGWCRRKAQPKQACAAEKGYPSLSPSFRSLFSHCCPSSCGCSSSHAVLCLWRWWR